MTESSLTDRLLTLEAILAKHFPTYTSGDRLKAALDIARAVE